MAVNAQRERVSAAPVGMFARLTTETKHAFKTTEFWAMVAIVVGILIASWIVDDGARRRVPGGRAWLYVAIVASAHRQSRAGESGKPRALLG